MKRIPVILVLVIIGVSIIIYFLSGVKPKDILDQYEKAYNAQNINGLMSLFSNDAVVEISEFKTLKTPEEIKNYFEYESVLSSRIKISDYSTQAYFWA